MRYAVPCLLFLANSEVISLIALLVLVSIFIADILKERAGKYDAN